MRRQPRYWWGSRGALRPLPAVLVMKTRKRHLRQGTEGVLASPDPEAGESSRIPPWSDLRVTAMRTSGGGSHQGDHLGHQVFLVPPLDRNLEIISLHLSHGANSSKTSLDSVRQDRPVKGGELREGALLREERVDPVSSGQTHLFS